MSLQYSVTLRNDQVSEVPVVLGSSAVLKILTGTPPANCGIADSGTLLSTINLPSSPFGSASSGSIAKSGTWSDPSAAGTGTAGYFRVYDGSAVCHMQGTITGTGGGGDMILDNTSISAGQVITINTFSISAGNA